MTVMEVTRSDPSRTDEEKEAVLKGTPKKELTSEFKFAWYNSVTHLYQQDRLELS